MKARATEETMQKWKVRRMEEMESGVRKCVAGVSIPLGDMFRKHGIPVHYSTIDCDDTIAAFAYHSGGSVLSRDCDSSGIMPQDIPGLLHFRCALTSPLQV